jgi:transposase-like protein
MPLTSAFVWAVIGLEADEALIVGQLEKAGCTAAARHLADDLDALVVHLRYPTRHRRRWRSTNLLERSLAEVNRRTKVTGRFPGETPAASPWSGPCSTSTPPTPPTALNSPNSNANVSNG